MFCWSTDHCRLENVSPYWNHGSVYRFAPKISVHWSYFDQMSGNDAALLFSSLHLLNYTDEAWEYLIISLLQVELSSNIFKGKVWFITPELHQFDTDVVLFHTMFWAAATGDLLTLLLQKTNDKGIWKGVVMAARMCLRNCAKYTYTHTNTHKHTLDLDPRAILLLNAPFCCIVTICLTGPVDLAMANIVIMDCPTRLLYYSWM